MVRMYTVNGEGNEDGILVGREGLGGDLFMTTTRMATVFRIAIYYDQI